MAAAAAGADEPILLRLHEQAPTLLRSAGPDEVVMHRLQLRQKAHELGIQDYVVGVTTVANPIPHLPVGASNANKTIGKRWLLSAFEDNNLRGMVAQHGGDSGPSCWDWIGRNLLGGRDEQEVLSYLLNHLRYDGSRTVMSFFSEFHTLASAIVPPLPDGRLCTMYASKFPAREYISVVSACDDIYRHAQRRVPRELETYAIAVPGTGVTLVGDPDRDPWAVVNEPVVGQTANCRFECMYFDATTTRPAYVVPVLVQCRPVLEGEHLTVYYGADYFRDYDLGYGAAPSRELTDIDFDIFLRRIGYHYKLRA
ncbi:hypothetical protein AB1Y20_021459 [Prymnesium parvum]|uniref:SET domain-containing protein n=1 Tax=Prymnesium parvum TaxID=97485 RepID=A0AB34JM41_PRYPA